ncbi:MAG: bifunctional 5,10-methylenetetrahydrofolate dehydrogenase/5,10-methenyltetrahydrofolate cyclohydrolase [Chloroflexi bacterium]|nr:bifunctional 5,10-methylenetetrahydrofolate dehydrogenase/5,10-methenyltetrahydrofolate cyclohydrolase [Chloroflexota bacterium]
MTATIIDGTKIAEDIRNKVKAEAAELKEKHGLVAGLATVLVGDNPGSHAYVRMKRKTCADLGLTSFGHELPATATQAEVVDLVRRLGADPAVHGILVQLPLPNQISEEAVLREVPLAKDVDGFNPVNIGNLGMKNRTPTFAPCTPAGVIELLDRTGTRIEGAHAVVLGRSNIVGLPVSLLLLGRNATLTVCHSRTKDIGAVTREADILVVAIGKTRFVTAAMVKPGAVVIDVGINEIPDATKKSGKRLVGDVDFDAVKEVAGAITPVPGGVGPMTIAMLMQNTLTAAKRSVGA